MPKQPSKNIKKILVQEKKEKEQIDRDTDRAIKQQQTLRSEDSLSGALPHTYSTLEQQKSKALLQLFHYLNTPDEETLKKTQETIASLLEINKTIEKTAIHTQQSIIQMIKGEKTDFTLEKEQLSEDSQVEKILAGLKTLLADTTTENHQLKDMLTKGDDSIDLIDDKLAKVLDIDKAKLQVLAYVLGCLKPLPTIIKKQSSLLNKIKEWTTSVKRAKKKEDTIRKTKFDLTSLYSTEKKEIGDGLREYVTKIPIHEEEERVTELLWLENQERQLTKNTLFFLNQFIIPTIKIPSGNVVCYTTTSEEAKKILSTHAINADTARTEKKEVIIGPRHEKISAIQYIINRISDDSKDSCFLFPIETIMEKRYFLVEDQTSGILEVFDRAPDSRSIIKEIENTLGHFDTLLTHLKKTEKVWFEQAQKLNHDFVRKWDQTAKKNIEKDFTKRWIKEESDSFAVESKLSFDVVKFLVEQRYWNSLFFRLFQAARGKPIEIKEKDEKDYLEEMQRMTKTEFIETIKIIKDTYRKIIRDSHDFQKTADLTIGVDAGIFIAPKKDVLPWEKFFDDNKYRPQVFYYEGTLSEGLREALATCKKNKRNKKPPKTRMVRIFSYLNAKPLQRL